MDVKQLNKIMKLYYFYALKALRDGQGKIKMYYGSPGLKSSYREKGLLPYFIFRGHFVKDAAGYFKS